MSSNTVRALVAVAVVSIGCGASDPSPQEPGSDRLRLAAVNLGLNANQPDVRERQDLYLSTMPGTNHSYLVDATQDFDIMCTNEMYTWSREDSYVAYAD